MAQHDAADMQRSTAQRTRHSMAHIVAQHSVPSRKMAPPGAGGRTARNRTAGRLPLLAHQRDSLGRGAGWGQATGWVRARDANACQRKQLQCTGMPCQCHAMPCHVLPAGAKPRHAMPSLAGLLVPRPNHGMNRPLSAMPCHAMPSSRIRMQLGDEPCHTTDNPPCPTPVAMKSEGSASMSRTSAASSPRCSSTSSSKQRMYWAPGEAARTPASRLQGSGDAGMGHGWARVACMLGS